MNIRAERLNRGLTVAAAAEAMGIDRRTLERAERERDWTPHPPTAKKIADFYGVLVTDIWPVEEANGDPVAA